MIGSDDGLKYDDTIEFTFYYSSGKDLGKIAINVYHSETGHRSEVGMVESVELQRRLLSIYTSDKSLVPEIFSIVKKKYLDRLIDEQYHNRYSRKVGGCKGTEERSKEKMILAVLMRRRKVTKCVLVHL